MTACVPLCGHLTGHGNRWAIDLLLAPYWGCVAEIEGAKE